MDRFVALKLLPSHLHHEVKSAAKLTHPHIVTAFDAGEHEGRPFLVMELIDGCDLQRHVQEQGPLQVDKAVDFIVQAARGLGYAHEQGIVHGDVKPANLILNKDGVVKVLDLGLARSSTEPTGITGTVDYLAPEKTEEPYRTDHRTDIYALGCTLYFLLTGKPVFDGRTALEKIVAHRETPAPTLPSPINAVFQRMVAKKPEDRFQLMTEVIQALAKKPGSRKTLWWVAGLLVVVLAGFELYQLNSPPPPVPVTADKLKESATVSKDRKAAEWVIGLGGKVTYAPLGQDAPIEAAALTDLPSQPFVVKSISLDRTTADDDGLVHLAGLDALEALRLNRTGVTDKGMIHLKGLPKLWFLELAGTQVGDGGMASVGTLHELRWLTLDGNPVTDQGLTHLQGRKKLETLRLNRLKITDDGLKSLEGLVNLTLLELVATGVTDEGMTTLAKLPRLRSVGMAETKVTEAGKAKLKKGSP
jgi:hypothetical protein